MRDNSFAKICAMILAVAGLLWIFKAGSILLTGAQPTLALELGQALFAVGILGIAFLTQHNSIMVKIGIASAAIGFTCTMLAIVYPLVPDAQISTGQSFVFPYSLFVLLGSAGGFLALLFLAAAFFQARGDLGRARFVPLFVAVTPLVFSIAGIVHIEIPILLIGLAWLGLALFIWHIANTRTTPALE